MILRVGVFEDEEGVKNGFRDLTFLIVVASLTGVAWNSAIFLRTIHFKLLEGKTFTYLGSERSEAWMRCQWVELVWLILKFHQMFIRSN